VRILVCPDAFAGTVSAVEAASAIAEGWRVSAPDDEIATLPLSDGGPGIVDVLHAALGGRLLDVPTSDPLGRPTRGCILLTGQLLSGAAAYAAAYVESAHACGLHLLRPAETDPKITTSYGLGALVTAAVTSGVREVVVGLGGSATNDAGAGMLAALGAAPLDAAGNVLPPGGAALSECACLRGVPRLGGVQLVAATDVDNPLTGPYGASAVFGPQKGTSRSDVSLLDAALERFASVLERDLSACPAGLRTLPGGGAAGGLGAAILACGGRRESGMGLVRRLTNLDAAISSCDLVVTGEGSFDGQSLRGKVVAGVANAARDLGVACVVLAGRVDVGRREARAAGVTESHSLAEHLGSVEAALAAPAEGLRALAAHVARRRGLALRGDAPCRDAR
jgi:glycerate kinase